MKTTKCFPEPGRRGYSIARRSSAALAALAVIGGAATADAAPLERGSFHDVGAELLEDFCGDIDLVHSWDVSGNYLGIARGSDRLVHFRDSVRGTEVWTNADTGKSFTSKWTTNSRDLKVTDNGDGTLSIVGQGSGGARYYDDNGKLVLRDPGLLRWEFRVDHAGTPANPYDDSFIEDSFVIVKGSTGRNDTAGHTFCEGITSFTT